MSGLRREDRIFVAGHRGLIGSALVEELNQRGYKHILTRTRAELDLLNQQDTYRFFEEERPDAVLIAAAKVGGIHANSTYRADFISENLQIQNNLIIGAHKFKIRRLVFLGSSCIYPRNCPQPMREESLLTGPLEYTNQPYAIAKISGLELVNTFRQQYGYDWFSVMPTNLYGPRDNFHHENSHVLPALIRRFEEARARDECQVVVWGTGEPKREFMFSADCARAIVNLVEESNLSSIFQSQFDNRWSHINVGVGEDIRIAELAEKIAKVVGFRGKIEFDRSKPDGTPRKLLDCSILRMISPSTPTPLEKGLLTTLDYFRSLNLSN